jgi:hypothetical protein
MAEDLKRFEELLSSDALAGALDGSALPATEDIGITADLAPIDKIIAAMVSKPKPRRSDYDLDMCEVLHTQLKHLPAAVAVDMRFWHWLCACRLQDFVWMRWNGELPRDKNAALTRSGMSDRFLGGRTLRGRNRNALSRLFFTADALFDNAQGYKLATSAFANQDRHVAIFERTMGLMPAVAKGLVRSTQGMGSEEIQKTAKRLNHMGSTLVLERIAEQDVVKILK